ncbi:rRNA maturation RNase YbeY [Chloroflexota bacterium]
MEINVLIDEVPEGCLETNWLQYLAEQILVAQGAGSSAELSLVITSQERVKQLNRSYRGKDEPTDVLAFSMLPSGGEIGTDLPPFIMPPDGVRHLGEVIISYPQAVIQAEEHPHSVNREITILIIHGVLHLLGYDHDTPDAERQMRAREVELLSQINTDNE